VVSSRAAAAVAQGFGSGIRQHFNKNKLCVCRASCIPVWIYADSGTRSNWYTNGILEVGSTSSQYMHQVSMCTHAPNTTDMSYIAIPQECMDRFEQTNAFKIYTKHTLYMMVK